MCVGKYNQNVAHMDKCWDNLDNVCGTCPQQGPLITPFIQIPSSPPDTGTKPLLLCESRSASTMACNPVPF